MRTAGDLFGHFRPYYGGKSKAAFPFWLMFILFWGYAAVFCVCGLLFFCFIVLF